MNYLSVLAEKWFQPCYELRGCWTPHWIFLSFFSPLSIPLLSLSPFLCIWTARSLHYTQGNYWSMEEPLANCSRLIDPEALTPRSVTLVERKPVLLLVVSSLDLCIKTRVFCVLIQPPPFFPQKCVCIYLFKQGFSVYLKFLGKILRFWIRHLSSWKEKSQNSVKFFFLMDVLIADCDF